MSGFEDEIWHMFAQETEEHLETIESLLLAAEAGHIGESDIAVLFRAFHSIKGLCRAMDLINMESVAHRAEDILGLARDGSCPLDAAMASLLIEAQDALAQMRRATLAGEPQGAAEDLVQRLIAMYATLTGGSGRTEPATAHIPAAPCQSPTTSGAASCSADCNSCVGCAPQGSQLHDDADMLRFYVDLLRENIPTLGKVLSESCQPDSEVCESCDGCHRLDSALDTLSLASDSMNFTNIGEALNALKEIKAVGVDLDSASRERFLESVPDLLSLLRHVEAETAADSGMKDLARNMSASVHAVLEGELRSIVRDLDELESSDGNFSIDDEAVAEGLFGKFSRADSFFAFLCPEHQSLLLLLLEDVFARVARGELQIYNELIELARDGVAITDRIHGLLRSGQPLDSDLKQRESELAACIHDYIWSNAAGENPLTTIKDFVRGLNINGELAEILTPENVRDLMEGVRQGQMVYELLAHLESEESVALGFLEWVEHNGRVITNRTVFIDGLTWYEMLFLSSSERDTLVAELARLDAGHGLLRLRSAEEVPVGEAQGSNRVSAPELSGTETSAATSARNPVAAESGGGSNVIRVPGETLDRFMIQIGEMVLVRGRLSHAINDAATREALFSLKRLAASEGMSGELQEALRLALDTLESQRRRLEETDALIQGALSRLQDHAMELRVVPVDTVFKRFPRVVRDIAQMQGKRIRLEVTGQEVRIDKAMVETLADPLLHMVRNAADHGIETPEVREAAGKPAEATLSLRAQQRGNRVMVQIADDGRGINTDRVLAKAIERGLARPDDAERLTAEDIYQFLFMPGFSTAEKVTETSGRGVGMDVVRTNVMRLGGSVSVESTLGRGSMFTLTMPLSAAVQEVLLIETGNQVLALPARYVEEVIEVEREDLQSVKGRAAILLRGAFLPLAHVADLLGFAHGATGSGSRIAVVLSNGQHTLGLIVDRTLGRQELFIKDIHPRLMALPGVGGASILGDGRPVLIIDGEGLLRLAEKSGPQSLAQLFAA